MSVFSKIFISFWLALAISIFATMLLNPPQPPEPPLVKLWRDLTQHALSLYATEIANQYEAQGSGSANKIADQLQRQHGIRLGLFDDKGQFLGGSSSESLPPPDIEPHDFPQKRNDSLLATFGVSGKSGRNYRVLAVTPANLFPGPPHRGGHPGPPGPWRDFDILRFSILVLSSGLVCYALARYLTAPLVGLRSAAHKLGGGDLSVRVPVTSASRNDEISSVVRAFNRMAEQIESLVNAQRRLTSDVSHELRSPLARLTVALDLARKKSSPEAEQALDRIEVEAGRLDDLIGEILRLSQLESSAMAALDEKVDLAELVAEIAGDAEFEARSKEAHVVCSILHPCTVVGDRELLRRAVENVLRNAVSYTAPGSEVSVSLTAEGAGGKRKAILSVRDHGPGVPENELTDIFRPFYRVAYDRDRKSGGTGLGLAISARAVQLHGGSIQAQNANDKGLMVKLSLPACSESVRPEKAGQPS